MYRERDVYTAHGKRRRGVPVVTRVRLPTGITVGAYHRDMGLLARQLNLLSFRGKDNCTAEQNRIKDMGEVVGDEELRHFNNDNQMDGDDEVYGDDEVDGDDETEGEIDALVSTPLLGRGIDIPKVSLTIITSPPQDPLDFICYSGRTGRGGRSGRSLVLLSVEESIKQLPQLNAHLPRSSKFRNINSPLMEYAMQYETYRELERSSLTGRMGMRCVEVFNMIRPWSSEADVLSTMQSLLYFLSSQSNASQNKKFKNHRHSRGLSSKATLAFDVESIIPTVDAYGIETDRRDWGYIKVGGPFNVWDERGLFRRFAYVDLKVELAEKLVTSFNDIMKERDKDVSPQLGSLIKMLSLQYFERFDEGRMTTMVEAHAHTRR